MAATKTRTVSPADIAAVASCTEADALAEMTRRGFSPMADGIIRCTMTDATVIQYALRTR